MGLQIMRRQDVTQIIEVEYIWNKEGKCNNPNCKRNRIFWCNAVINKITKRKVPLNDPYVPSSGFSPRQHDCMNEYPPGVFLKDDLPNDYILNNKPFVQIVRCGNSPVFKCLYCGQRGDLPIMKEHHKEGRCLIKQKQEEWKETEKEPNIVDLKNQRMDAFIQKIESVWTV